MSEQNTMPDNVFEMSDEEVSKLSIHQFSEMTSEKPEKVEEEKEVLEEEETEEEEIEQEEAEELEDSSPSPRDVYTGEGTAEEEKPEEESVETKPSSKAVDYKAEYEKLLSPFRANKRDMQVQNVEEARQLMQMGVDYSDKMRDLKKDLRLVTTLKKNGLFDEAKINFLIDLDKGVPQAVTQYLKDRNLDPMDLDLDPESSYRPKVHTVSEKEAALDSILEEIKGTESFDRTLDELGNKWDTRSKEVLLDNPLLIRAINEQIGNGIYDKIWTVVERERTFGRLVGMPDLEAYKTVGDQLNSAGLLHPVNGKGKPKVKPPEDPRLKERKRAASPTRGIPSKGSYAPNMLNLSDDEFEKVSVGSFS